MDIVIFYVGYVVALFTIYFVGKQAGKKEGVALGIRGAASQLVRAVSLSIDASKGGEIDRRVLRAYLEDMTPLMRVAVRELVDGLRRVRRNKRETQEVMS